MIILVPLYFTPRYRELMTHIIAKEINRVYRLFVIKNPDFLERHGQVSIFGHSLGVKKKKNGYQFYIERILTHIKVHVGL